MLLVSSAMLGGCGAGFASPVKSVATLAAPMNEATLRERGVAALTAGEAKPAIAAFSELTARRPRDPVSQTLLALPYQKAGATDPEATELALAGYDLALKAEPGNFWAAAMAGRAAFDRGRFEEATKRFAQAVVAKPDDPEAMLALASAAYRSGDPVLVATAAGRANDLSGTNQGKSAALRLAAIAEAAAGQAARAAQRLAELARIDPASASATDSRLRQLMQTAPVDQLPAGQMPPQSEAPSQISVDVAILLAQNTARAHRHEPARWSAIAIRHGSRRHPADQRR
jgi:predicted Zn-dependent protease